MKSPFAFLQKIFGTGGKVAFAPPKPTESQQRARARRHKAEKHARRAGHLKHGRGLGGIR